MYSWGDGDKMKYHGPMQYGGFKMTINQDFQSVSFDETGLPPTEASNFYFLHGLSMYIAWGILPILMLISGRYIRHLYKFRMWIHRIVGLIILLTTVGWGLYIMYTEHAISTDGIGSFHNFIGKVLCVWVAFQVLGGVLNRILLRRLGAKRSLGYKIFISK